MTEAGIARRAAVLRHEFDRSFAAPSFASKSAIEDLLAIRLGAHDFALRLSEIAGLFADKKITPVPGGGVALLGIAGFRRSIVPVYDLRKLMGIPGSSAPRWLVIAAVSPVALAFETFEGQLRVSLDAIAAEHAQTKAHNHTQGFVQSDKILRPIIHLPSLLHAIKT
jgi:chemotaxis signal transduction protein